MLRSGIAMQAALSCAPHSMKYANGEPDPQGMRAASQQPRTTEKGSHCYFRTKAHIDVESACGLVYSGATAAANVNDVTMPDALLHVDKGSAYGCAFYQGVYKPREAAGPRRHVAMHPGQRRNLNPFIELDVMAERMESIEASIRARSAPVPRAQARVRIHEGAPPRTGEEHGADRRAVRAGKLVDGTQAVDAGARMRPSPWVARPLRGTAGGPAA